MSENSIGIGIIGAGFLAETRARCYEQHRGLARILAVASRTEEKARGYAERHGVPKAFAGYEELLNLSDRIRELILDRRPASEIRRAAQEEGMAFLRESALQKVLDGVTTLREINKVTFVD